MNIIRNYYEFKKSEKITMTISLLLNSKTYHHILLYIYMLCYVIFSYWVMTIYDNFLLLIDWLTYFKVKKIIYPYVDYHYNFFHFKIFYQICIFRTVYLCGRCQNVMTTITRGIENNVLLHILLYCVEYNVL